MFYKHASIEWDGTKWSKYVWPLHGARVDEGEHTIMCGHRNSGTFYANKTDKECLIALKSKMIDNLEKAIASFQKELEDVKSIEI